MKIDTLVLGDYQTNSYVLRATEDSANCLIVDTGIEAQPLLEFLGSRGLNPVAVVLTHGHADHIAALGPLREKYPAVKVYIHKLDADMLTDKVRNLSALAGISFSGQTADVLLEDGNSVEETGLTLDVLHTPGHTPGGICLYAGNEGILFTGDTLFADSVGRTDFPGGSMPQLVNSIRTKLCPLPDETICYPGHGPQTTIGREKRYNQYLR